MEKISLILGKSHLSFSPEATVVRKRISDSRENPQLTTTTQGEASGPLEHKLKRTGRTEHVGGRRKGWSQINEV